VRIVTERVAVDVWVGVVAGVRGAAARVVRRCAVEMEDSDAMKHTTAHAAHTHRNVRGSGRVRRAMNDVGCVALRREMILMFIFSSPLNARSDFLTSNVFL